MNKVDNFLINVDQCFPLGPFCTDVQFPQGGGFLTRDKKDKARKIRLPEQSWIQTPSIVNIGSGKKNLSFNL